MLPSQTRKASKIRIRGHHRATVLNCHRRVLRVSYQLPPGPCVTTKPFEDCQVVGTWANNAGVRAL